MPGPPLSVGEYEQLAAEVLEPGALGYFAGGAGDERTLRDNVAAYGRWRLRPRMLVDVGAVNPAATVLGARVSMPVLVAPTAFLRLAHADGEPGVARAAAAAGTIYCLSTLATATPAEIAVAAPDGVRWFQLYCYRDRGITRSLVAQAVDAGFAAIVLTVDMPYLGRRERDLRTGFAVPAETPVPSFAAATGRSRGATLAEMVELLDPTLTWHDVAAVAAMSDLPVIVKGILTPQDARLAQEHGAAAIAVSNHGGRQLDGVQASLDALPDVAAAVAGGLPDVAAAVAGGLPDVAAAVAGGLPDVAAAVAGGLPVIVDGGIRRGTDVVTALALGAQAVMIGRPVIWGLAVGGEAGVARVLGLMHDEVRLALALLGCQSPAAVEPAHVVRAAG